MNEKAKYLPGLNGLRALAAMAVLIAHSLEKFEIHLLDTLSSYSVTVFFCLSGFLITYLLLIELSNTGKISLKQFYIRRTLRIWPLYFLYLGIAIYITWAWSLEPVSIKSVLPHLLFFPNFIDPHALVWHYWSIGVEEQFYLFWPVLILLFRKRFLTVFVGFTIFWILLKAFVSIDFGGNSQAYHRIYTLEFSSMSVGAIGAVIFRSGTEQFLSLLSNKLIQVLAWIILIAISIGKLRFASIIDHEILCAATVVIILSLIRSQSILKLENRVMNDFGTISFGIYIIHPLIIFLLGKGFQQFGFALQGFKTGLIFCLLVITITYLLSKLSNRWVERPFLSLKRKISYSTA